LSDSTTAHYDPVSKDYKPWRDYKLKKGAAKNERPKGFFNKLPWLPSMRGKSDDSKRKKFVKIRGKDDAEGSPNEALTPGVLSFHGILFQKSKKYYKEPTLALDESLVEGRTDNAGEMTWLIDVFNFQ